MAAQISALPTPPTRQDPTNFNDRADAFLSALPTFQTEANALSVEVNSRADNVQASDLAVMAATNITKWVSGTTYAEGAVVWSPINGLGYRRITASGSGTTDPSLDTTNYKQVNGTGDVSTSGDQTISGVKTFSSNLGVGVTPSAWSIKAMQVDSSSIASSSNDTYIQSNAFFDGNWKYINAAEAAQYYQVNGTHIWRTAASGTANNIISFTQAMTLDANGNLGITTTTPFSTLDLGSFTQGTRRLSFDNAVGLFPVRGGGNISLAFGYQPSSTVGGGYQSSYEPSIGRSLIAVGANNGIQFFTDAASSVPVGTAVTPTERARFDINGNLAIATTSSGGHKLHVSFDNSAESGLRLSHTSSTYTNNAISFLNQGGTTVGSVKCTATSTTYNTSSDYRLKYDIAPMQNALQRVAALKPVTYKWNADDSDGEGFIAHELAAVCPQAVTGEKDAVDADGKPVYQGIDTSFLVATLTAAIQEQQVIIEQLRGRIEALEAK